MSESDFTKIVRGSRIQDQNMPTSSKLCFVINENKLYNSGVLGYKIVKPVESFGDLGGILTGTQSEQLCTLL